MLEQARQTKKRMRITAVIIGIAMVAIILGLTSAMSKAESPRRTLVVSSQATVKVDPDFAVFNIGVEKRAKTVSEAREQNAQAMDAVYNRLLELGVPEKDMQTKGFSLQQEWHYDNKTGDRTLTGYRVVNTLQVTVRDLDKLGVWLDAAMEDGANQISGPTFGSANTADVELVALRKAVQHARAKADAIAAASGVFIKGISNINEHVSVPMGGAMYAMDNMMFAEAARSAPTTIATGELSVTANVTITFEI